MADVPVPQDLDTRKRIERFVDLFYERMLEDEQLAPIFVDVAEIDLSQHLPHIKNYWSKLLLGDPSYQRHTMNIHRQLHSKRALKSSDFDLWVATFVATVDSNFAGIKADRAKRVALTIAENMQKGLKQ
ncbi:MAG: group III truncated hemoglobin [Halioglobus sp.]